MKPRQASLGGAHILAKRLAAGAIWPSNFPYTSEYWIEWKAPISTLRKYEMASPQDSIAM
jgi:hypothetical protein